MELSRTGCASLPGAALASLADLRREPGVSVALVDGRAWIWWPPGNESVLRRIFPIAGAVLYTRRDGRWYPLGKRLPSFEVPTGEEPVPLSHLLFPAPISQEQPTTAPAAPVPLGLRRDGEPRAATALRCSLEALGTWADQVPSSQFDGLRAAMTEGEAMVVGSSLPTIAGAERFWGVRVLVPLGFRPDPMLPESAIREIVGAGEALIVLQSDGVELVPIDVFRPLGRAGVRLALGVALRAASRGGATP